MEAFPPSSPEMNTTQHDLIMQRWTTVQYELLPDLKVELGCLTPKLEKVIHVLEWVRIEEFVDSTWQGVGRPPHDRCALASAFVAKAVLGLSTTVALIERLTIDRALRRICGFPLWKKLPDEATFSRACGEFAQSKLAERTHEALVKEYLGEELIGHISRDGTAIKGREKPTVKAVSDKTDDAASIPQSLMTEAEKPLRDKADDEVPLQQPLIIEAKESVLDTSPLELLPSTPKKHKRGRPKKDEVREPKTTKIRQQLKQTLPQILADLPITCDRGCKCNAQGYKVSWNGYKLHIDTADCGVPISALLTSASTHDSLTAVPLALITSSRVTNCYDLMDAAYCSEDIREHSHSLGHVPLIDHNPRKGEKKPFEPHEAERYKERSQAERTNARLKEEFGGDNIWVRGPAKVMSHLMFGLLALSADQLMRLFT